MQTLLSELAALSEWQIYLLVAGLLLQGFIISIFPEEVFILALGYLWANGRVGFAESFLAIVIGLLPANAACFWLARRYGLDLVKRRPFRWLLSERGLLRAIDRMQRHGLTVLFLTRFTPIVRGPLYMAAGMSGMSLGPFLRVEFLAACLQIPALLICGRYLSHQAGLIAESLQWAGYVAAGLLLVYLLQIAVRRPERNNI